jgi:hypothetical protein
VAIGLARLEPVGCLAEMFFDGDLTRRGARAICTQVSVPAYDVY